MIENGKKVTINYQLLVDDQIIDDSSKAGPLEYKHGSGEIIPGLERALEGLKPGDAKEVHIGPDDAYGPINPRAIIEVPKDQLPEGEIEVGILLKGKDEKGRPLQGIVREVLDDAVKVDFNHPLAGKELFFKIEIVAVSE